MPVGLRWRGCTKRFQSRRNVHEKRSQKIQLSRLRGSDLFIFLMLIQKF